MNDVVRENNSSNLDNRKLSFIEISTLKLFGVYVIAFFIITLSFSLLSPIAIVMVNKYIINRRYINGRKLKFTGTIGELYIKYIIWLVLFVVTLGIFSFWIAIKYLRWKTENTIFEDSDMNAEASKFTGKVKEYVLISFVAYLLIPLTLGIATPWIITTFNKWIYTNTYINGEHLEYTTSGKALAKKYFIWLFFSIITLNIYFIWFLKKMIEWNSTNTTITNNINKDKVGKIFNDLFLKNKILIAPAVITIILYIGIALLLMDSKNNQNDFIIIDGILISYIGDSADVVIPDEVIEIAPQAFLENQNIETLIIPDGVEKIGAEAFKNCRNIKYLRVGNSVKIIETEAFYNCIGMEYAFIPQNVLTIKNDAFGSCLNLTVFTNRWNNHNLNWDSNLLDKFDKIIFQVTNIDEDFQYAYRTSYEDDNLKIVQYLGDETEVSIPDNIDGFTVKTIGREAFYKNEKLTSVFIPNTVTVIEYSAFSGCKNLENIKFSESLISIFTDAFSYCTSLKNIIFPESLLYIESSAFRGCSNLENFLFPKGLKTIGSGAFESCSNLTEVYLLESIERLDQGIFRGIENLTIYLEATNKPSGWTVGWNEKYHKIVWGAEMPQQ